MRLPRPPLAVWLAVSVIVTFTLNLLAQEKAAKKYPNPYTGSYKNLKVLMPEQVQTTMLSARGVFGGCSYCHVIEDWPNDSNPKKAIGRMMMSMVNEINAKFGDGKVHVTCYTCHRGEVTPLMKAPEAADGAAKQ